MNIRLVIVGLILLFFSNSILFFTAYASNLEVIQQLKRLNEALKQTQERIKNELKDKNNQEINSQSFQRNIQEVFQEEYKNTQMISYKEDDSIFNQALRQCDEMKKSKEDLVSGAGKKVLTGAAIGAAIGAAAGGKKRREEGAILGAISGAMAGLAYELWTKKDLFEESPEKLAKRVKYNPSNGLYLKIGEIVVKNENVKTGDNLRLILRVEYLFPEFFSNSVSENKNLFMFGMKPVSGEKNEESSSVYHTIKIRAYVINKDNQNFVAEEEYSIPPGTTPFLYVFPICDAIPRGEHEIKFVVERMGIKDEKIVRFTKI
ncbi:hypothetical protein THC_0703 [Caldimicrobium thiodismutans]|uniref:Glycine zipper domain-containing protein n=1 Tax=Caldimicrobium thiodismutans TaxID=1653476 RepID=A0A0U5AGH7_9BACT|nr:hypothetical protein [Caldimicrobium thiodismutans]BAU23095.1 hypothetical protein THC_0703 [Caldimicrobium thiodismutans]